MTVPPQKSGGDNYYQNSNISRLTGPVNSDASPILRDGNPAKKDAAFEFSGYTSLPTLKQIREEVVGKMEHGYLSELIRRCEGSFSTAQRLSGLSRARLYELLQKHSLSI
jgi:transcriptional regulator of acetoin/glycerol metabolism